MACWLIKSEVDITLTTHRWYIEVLIIYLKHYNNILISQHFKTFSSSNCDDGDSESSGMAPRRSSIPQLAASDHRTNVIADATPHSAPVVPLPPPILRNSNSRSSNSVRTSGKCCNAPNGCGDRKVRVWNTVYQEICGILIQYIVVTWINGWLNDLKLNLSFISPQNNSYFTAGDFTLKRTKDTIIYNEFQKIPKCCWVLVYRKAVVRNLFDPRARLQQI